MAEPVPELDAEEAVRGVVNQLTIHGQQLPVIIPRSVIDMLPVLGELLRHAEGAGYLLPLARSAMPWAAPLSDDDMRLLLTDMEEAAASGDHAPERLSAVMRGWRETAEIISDPEAMAELAESEDAIARGDVLRGREAIEALRRQQ